MTSGTVEALTALVISGGVLAVIWVIGQVIYQIEERYQHDRDYRRSKSGGVGKQFHKTPEDGEHSEKLGKARSRRKHER